MIQFLSCSLTTISQLLIFIIYIKIIIKIYYLKSLKKLKMVEPKSV